MDEEGGGGAGGGGFNWRGGGGHHLLIYHISPQQRHHIHACHLISSWMIRGDPCRHVDHILMHHANNQLHHPPFRLGINHHTTHHFAISLGPTIPYCAVARCCCIVLTIDYDGCQPLGYHHHQHNGLHYYGHIAREEEHCRPDPPSSHHGHANNTSRIPSWDHIALLDVL